MITITILGYLGADPETRTSGGGHSFTGGRVGSSHKSRNGDKVTTWLSYTVFGARGEAFGRNHAKGDRVLLTGELYTEEWTDRDGQQRDGLKLDVQGWAFAKSDRHPEQGGGGAPSRSRAGNPNPAQTQAADGDIPF